MSHRRSRCQKTARDTRKSTRTPERDCIGLAQTQTPGQHTSLFRTTFEILRVLPRRTRLALVLRPMQFSTLRRRSRLENSFGRFVWLPSAVRCFFNPVSDGEIATSLAHTDTLTFSISTLPDSWTLQTWRLISQTLSEREIVSWFSHVFAHGNTSAVVIVVLRYIIACRWSYGNSSGAPGVERSRRWQWRIGASCLAWRRTSKVWPCTSSCL